MTVHIPQELLPSDGRFGSGPSKVRLEAAAALADAGATYLGTSHRREGVRSVVRSVREGLTELFALPDGYEVLLGTGGSTVFWDAAAFGIVEQRAEHLVFGEFSSKFAGVTARRAVPRRPARHRVAAGHPSRARRRPVGRRVRVPAQRDVDRRDDGRPPPADADGLMLVDGTSGAAGLRVDPAQFDVYYFAPQKAFAADAGIWVALCSPAAIERIDRVGASGRWVPPSLSLPIALENSRLDQTYNTPPLGSIFLLAHTVRWMLDQGGLEWTTTRCDRSAEIVYGWAEASAYATPYVAKPSERSHTIACIDFVDTVDAAAVAAALRANGIIDTEPYRKLGRNQLRIALFPAIEPDDLAALTRCIDFVIDAL